MTEVGIAPSTSVSTKKLPYPKFIANDVRTVWSTLMVALRLRKGMQIRRFPAIMSLY